MAGRRTPTAPTNLATLMFDCTIKYYFVDKHRPMCFLRDHVNGGMLVIATGLTVGRVN